MKHSKKAAAIAAAALLVLILPFTMSAASAGTPEDPLVTLSYISTTFKSELKGELISEIKNQLGDDFLKQLKSEIIKELNIDLSGGSADASAADMSFKVEKLTNGQKVKALGACEIILRSGSAVAFVELEENILAGVGLSDCTTGDEILNNTDIPRRHLLIIPRGDGRGVYATSPEAYLMVRGEYEIVK